MVRKPGRILPQMHFWVQEEISLYELFGEGDARLINFYQ